MKNKPFIGSVTLLLVLILVGQPVLADFSQNPLSPAGRGRRGDQGLTVRGEFTLFTQQALAARDRGGVFSRALQPVGMIAGLVIMVTAAASIPVRAQEASPVQSLLDVFENKESSYGAVSDAGKSLGQYADAGIETSRIIRAFHEAVSRGGDAQITSAILHLLDKKDPQLTDLLLERLDRPITASETEVSDKETLIHFATIDNKEDPRFLQELYKRYPVKNPDINDAIIGAFKFLNIPETTEIFLNLLSDPARHRRIMALDALAHRKEASAATRAFPLLFDSDGQIAGRAATLIADLGSSHPDHSVIDAMVTLLYKFHETSFPFSAAMHALSIYKNPDAVPAIAPFLQSDDAGVRAWAVGTLVSIGSSEALDALEQRLPTETGINAFGLAVQGLREHGRPVNADFLLNLVTQRGKLFDSALRELAEQREPKVVKPLIALLSDGEKSIRDQAAFAIKKMAMPEFHDPLVEAIRKETDQFMLRDLLGALSQTPGPRSAEDYDLLTSLYAREDIDVADDINQLLKSWGASPEQRSSIYRAGIKSGNNLSRSAAAAGFRDLGDPQFIPLLKQQRDKETDSYVKESLYGSLKALEKSEMTSRPRPEAWLLWPFIIPVLGIVAGGRWDFVKDKSFFPTFYRHLVSSYWTNTSRIQIPLQIPDITGKTPDEIKEQIIELANPTGKTDPNLYALVAQYLKINGGIGVDLGTGSQYAVVQGLVAAGIQKMYCVEKSLEYFLDGVRLPSRIKRTYQDGLNLRFKDGSVRVAVFNESLRWFFSSYRFSEPPKIIWDQRATYEEELLETFRILEPGGWVLIKPGTYLTSSRAERKEEGTLCEALLRQIGFRDIEVLQTGATPVFLWARKPTVISRSASLRSKKSVRALLELRAA